MALQYLESSVIGAYLVDAWQNYLETEADPVDGKWFRNGPKNTPGLFGGLKEILVTDLVFGAPEDKLNTRKEVALSTTLDNRDGFLNDSAATQTLNWTITNSATATHATSNAVKTGISEKLTFKGKFGSVEVSSETTISFEYSYSWSDSTSNTQTDSKSFVSTIPLKVPAGKAYELFVVADKGTGEIPYSAQIALTGTSEANFAHPVKGKTNWSADAGTVCGWIKKYGSAKGDTMDFDVDPADPTRGLASLHGTMKVAQAIHFRIFAIDVTDTLKADPESKHVAKQLEAGQQPGGVVVAHEVAVAPPAPGGSA
ncbi:MAG: ETX/MTX2 family pore-forming toxin [Vicinamibacterales bacterium]